jgi:hypothetical protein
MESDPSMGERKRPATVRVSPEFHKQLIMLKEATGASLEYLVGDALKLYLGRPEKKKYLRAFKRGAQKDDPPAHFQLPAASGMSGRR